VIAVGRINNPALADQIIANGDADFVAMGRPLLADPWLPKKAKEGRTQEIRMCTGCNYCAGERFMNYRQVRCAINAEAGRESAYALKPALRKKRVLIVGAGPAGMEAARILTARGHEVFLYEKEEYLGGNLRYAYLAPHKEEWKCFLDYLTSQMARLGDHVRLGKTVGEEDLQELNPDAVVIATGTDAIIPNIKGIGSADVVLATDILSMKREAGSTVVVIGGGSVGCEVAEFLVQRGRKVTIVEACKDLARSVEPSTRSLLLERLANDGVIMLNECMVKAIEGDKLFLSSSSGQGKEVNADTIVVAVGYAPNRSILEGLYMKATEVFRVGDCKKSGSVADAIHNASWIARQI
jgi:NADPH-dependent 2,4-dienoyl-CoA reductase/sulfur reductase-like enzyme